MTIDELSPEERKSFNIRRLSISAKNKKPPEPIPPCPTFWIIMAYDRNWKQWARPSRASGIYYNYEAAARAADGLAKSYWREIKIIEVTT